LVNLTTQYHTKINDQNTSTWEPSWKERFTHEACLRKKEQYKDDPETLSGEFYNTPIMAGKRIKKQMIRFVKPKSFDSYLVIIGNWDLAYSTTACFKAMAVLGVSGIRMTVIDIFCRQTADIETALDYHYTQANIMTKLNGSSLYYYDASVAQEAVYSTTILRSAMKHKSICIPLPQKSHTDKPTKIDTVLVGSLISGILDFSEDLKENPDWDEAERQMLRFEKGGKYPVDFPDALSDAILKAQEYLIDDESEDDEINNKPIIGKRERGGY